MSLAPAWPAAVRRQGPKQAGWGRVPLPTTLVPSALLLCCCRSTRQRGARGGRSACITTPCRTMVSHHRGASEPQRRCAVAAGKGQGLRLAFHCTVPALWSRTSGPEGCRGLVLSRSRHAPLRRGWLFTPRCAPPCQATCRSCRRWRGRSRGRRTRQRTLRLWWPRARSCRASAQGWSGWAGSAWMGPGARPRMVSGQRLPAAAAAAQARVLP